MDSIAQRLTPNEYNVVNLSSRTLTTDELTLLSRGLNFCPTPGEPNISDLSKDLEKFHLSTRRTSFFMKDDAPSFNHTAISQSSQTISNHTQAFDHPRFKHKSNWKPTGHPILESMILFNEQSLHDIPLRAPHQQNLTIGEKKALADLTADKSIVIKPADKGSAVVILDRQRLYQ